MTALLKAARRLSDPYKITNGRTFKLKNISPGETRGLKSKPEAQAELQRGVRLLCEMQEKLYAQDRWSVLLIFQAMDAAGKDSTIAHVMSGVNPQGCQVYSFKQPSAEELDHDYLWRTTTRLPERGRIGIFNRSYYEEVLVVRVHPEYLEAQRLPQPLNRNLWKQRFEDIRHFEQHLARNGTVILKFFLHVSKKEQQRRLLARLDDPDKHWKFSVKDAEERRLWQRYQHAYEDMIRYTASRHAPWYVVPANHKWFTRVVVAAAVASALGELDLKFPRVSASRKGELMRARAELQR
jgi:PPK2 family polyphosphate:nucleotide phosphotransferase